METKYCIIRICFISSVIDNNIEKNDYSMIQKVFETNDIFKVRKYLFKKYDEDGYRIIENTISNRIYAIFTVEEFTKYFSIVMKNRKVRNEKQKNKIKNIKRPKGNKKGNKKTS